MTFPSLCTLWNRQNISWLLYHCLFLRPAALRAGNRGQWDSACPCLHTKLLLYVDRGDYLPILLGSASYSDISRRFSYPSSIGHLLCRHYLETFSYDMARKLWNTLSYSENSAEQLHATRKPSRRQSITYFAAIVFRPALDLRSIIQRNRGASGPLSEIILLNGLSQEIKPLMCASRERFCFVFLFQRMFWRSRLNLWLKDNEFRYHLWYL